MAVAMYLNIPEVPGESLAKGYENQIDIFSFSLGASNPSSVGTGGGSGAGKVSISSMSVQKAVDAATPPFFMSCCQGNHYAKATLTVSEAGGTTPVTYLVLNFTQVFVDSISWGGASGGDKPSESASFSFATMQVQYTEQSATGTGGTPVTVGWNLPGNTSL